MEQDPFAQLETVLGSVGDQSALLSRFRIYRFPRELHCEWMADDTPVRIVITREHYERYLRDHDVDVALELAITDRLCASCLTDVGHHPGSRVCEDCWQRQLADLLRVQAAIG